MIIIRLIVRSPLNPSIKFAPLITNKKHNRTNNDEKVLLLKNVVKKGRTMWVISLVPIVEVDTAALAGDATDYTITTQQDFVDILVYGFTSGLIKSRVVKVTK